MGDHCRTREWSRQAEGLALILDHVTTPRGELVLRREEEHFEVISNGTFLMDTRNGESEQALVRAALCAHSSPRQVLIGGLGMGFSLREALAHDGIERVVAIEIEPTLHEWHRSHLAHLTRDALADERCEVVLGDLLAYLADTSEQYDAICLDIDNGPDWTVTDSNAGLYTDEGTELLVSRLTPDGVLTVWSAARSAAYERVLARHFGQVGVVEIPVPRGEPDVVFAATEPVKQTRGRDSDSS